MALGGVASLDAPPSGTRRHDSPLWIGLLLALPAVVPNGRPSRRRHGGSIRRCRTAPFRLRHARRAVGRLPFFVRAGSRGRAISTVHADRDGPGVAYVYSVIGRSRRIFPVTSAAIALGCGHFEAAAVITVLGNRPQVLALRAREAESGASNALRQLAPKTASDGGGGLEFRRP